MVNGFYRKFNNAFMFIVIQCSRFTGCSANNKCIYSAVDLANTMGVPVCDCYSQWKALSKTQDTTMLLANRINHPTKEMHQLFADSLYAMLFPDTLEE